MLDSASHCILRLSLIIAPVLRFNVQHLLQLKFNFISACFFTQKGPRNRDHQVEMSLVAWMAITTMLTTTTTTIAIIIITTILMVILMSRNLLLGSMDGRTAGERRVQL